jgi:hypothetical protein
MPRGRKTQDGANGADGQPATKGRQRKKKESVSVCSGTPTGDNKLDQSGMLCRTQMGMEAMASCPPPPFHLQTAMQQHGGNIQFLGQPDENMQQQPPHNGMPMQHFGQPPHPEFFFNPQQGPFQPPPPMFGIPQHHVPPHAQMPVPGQFNESEGQQPFMFHSQLSPIPHPPPAQVIQQQMIARLVIAMNY